MRIYHIVSFDAAMMDALDTVFGHGRRIAALENSMSILSDKIAEVKQAFDAAVARNQADDAANKAKIAELQALVDSGGATAQDIADLEALRVIADGLDATNPSVVPPSVAAASRYPRRG